MRIPKVETVSLIRVEFLVGTGTSGEVDDPIRIAVAYFQPDGKLLWCDDPMVPLGNIETMCGKRES